MTVDLVAKEFFSEQLEQELENGVCFDCKTSQPQWASVSHGVYLSIAASGVHRSLGVGVSFVQSTTMDSWKPLHLTMMKLGGNRRFREFLEEHGVPEDTPIREKYRTRAAEWYRKNLRALAEGAEPPRRLLIGTGHLPASGCTSPTSDLLDRVFRRADAQPPQAGSPRAEPLRARTLSPVKARRGSLQRVHVARDALPSHVVGKGNTGAAGQLATDDLPGAAPSSRDRLARSTSDGVHKHRQMSMQCASVPAPSFLDQLTSLSKGHRTAARLRRMSTGTMEGLDSSSCMHRLEVQATVAVAA